MLKTSFSACMDCGSNAIQTIIDEVKPVYREEVVQYACGAVLRSMTASRGQRGRVSHEGCTAGENIRMTVSPANN